uniref:OCIA domain-containing protein 1 n=1 Tax=Oncorhynchus kisutch TaxID=8019 RepID=A0A8C7FRK9_ONCKI
MTTFFLFSVFPITAVAVSVAQVLVMKGEVLAPSLRFGNLPKVAISGLFGYIGGKNSYTKLSQEKSLKQGQRHIAQQFAPQNQSELGDANKQICCVVILFLPQQCKNNQYGDAWVE